MRIPTDKLATWVPLLGNQRGMALIIAISLLAVMSVLASMLLNTSTSEIQLSGNYRTQQEAFYAAERAIEYAYVKVAIGETEVDLYNDTDTTNPGNPLHRSRIDLPVGNQVSGLDPTAINRVQFIGTNPPPPGSGSDASAFQTSRNYMVQATGKFPVSAANGSRTSMQSQVVKVVPK